MINLNNYYIILSIFQKFSKTKKQYYCKLEKKTIKTYSNNTTFNKKIDTYNTANELTYQQNQIKKKNHILATKLVFSKSKSA
jgi:hypothetical protein